MPPRNITIRRLAKPTDAEVEILTSILMVGFYDDPATQAILGGHHTDNALYRTFWRVRVLALAHSGEIWIAEDELEEDEAKRIVGFSGWFPPGRTLFDTEEQRDVSQNAAFMAMLPEDVREWWRTDFIPQVSKLFSDAVGPAAPTDNWYLLLLAVKPEYQGKGVGRALLQLRAGTAIQEGNKVIWQAVQKDKVAMYEHWGATVKGSSMFARRGVTQFSMWIMELRELAE